MHLLAKTPIYFNTSNSSQPLGSKFLSQQFLLMASKLPNFAHTRLLSYSSNCSSLISKFYYFYGFSHYFEIVFEFGFTLLLLMLLAEVFPLEMLINLTEVQGFSYLRGTQGFLVIGLSAFSDSEPYTCTFEVCRNE